MMNNEMKNEGTLIDEETVSQVKEQMPPMEHLYELAELFKAFSDSTRVRILWALSKSEMCVGDLAAVLDMTSTAISHQLRLLKQSRLVSNRRDGRVMYYRLSDDHVRTMFAMGMEHIEE